MHKVPLASLLSALIITTPLLSLQQAKTFQLQRPDVMINQGLDHFDTNILTFKRWCCIVGASACAGVGFWTYANAQQRLSELKHRRERAANDRNLQEQKSLLPQVSPVVIQIGKQKPANKNNGIVGRDVAKYMQTFIPDERFAKGKHQEQRLLLDAQLTAATTHHNHLKTVAWAIPLTTLTVLGKLDDTKNIIRTLTGWVLTPMIDAPLYLAQGEIRKSLKPLFWCAVSYYIITRARTFRRLLFGF